MRNSDTRYTHLPDVVGLPAAHVNQEEDGRRPQVSASAVMLLTTKTMYFLFLYFVLVASTAQYSSCNSSRTGAFGSKRTSEKSGNTGHQHTVNFLIRLAVTTSSSRQVGRCGQYDMIFDQSGTHYAVTVAPTVDLHHRHYNLAYAASHDGNELRARSCRPFCTWPPWWAQLATDKHVLADRYHT